MPPLLAVRAITITPSSISNYLFLWDLSIGKGSHFRRKNERGKTPRKTGISPDETYEKRLMEGVFGREDYSFH